MLKPFSIRAAEQSPVWERAVQSVNCPCLSWALVKFCACPFFSFGACIEGGLWDVIVLIPKPPVILLSAVPRRLFWFGSLVFLDVVFLYLSLFLLYININIGKNRCLMLD